MFFVDALPDSSSDSDCEIPKFEISAFKKFGSGIKSNPKVKETENFHNKSITLSSSLDTGEAYKGTYINFYTGGNSIKNHLTKQKEILQKTLDENLKKSIVFQPDFPKLEQVPSFQSKRQIKKQSKKERAKTTGDQWYNMSAPEMTEEKKNDLMVIQMRNALDPKRFYKRSANKINSKYFEVGTFVESPVDFYSSRVPKKQRKQTLVDELLADAEFRQYQKRKYTEIQKTPYIRFNRRKKLTHSERVANRGDNKRKKKSTKKS
ncbi:deoxynucleotidyltransferase terminal-interacting protein 2 [Trichonephila inaurata madagascariensis]|uniref:Deoxynucleotidyltransferase terminal-interacting protein 2 n=1 Tax=Trichonephila inaurata madagascariensis TaxID=2747483 RepID=A0A8X6XH62_9ARAC|nr:deoxynucleotidyltransferase terminal-interacting protein 2 [Trichonephila inaurata madagascariensis]